MTGMLAYVGPGPGLTMMWAFLGLLGTIALAILSILLYPIRMILRKIKGTPDEVQQSSDTSNTGAQ